MKMQKSPFAIRRELQRVRRLHVQNVRRKGTRLTERDHAMMLGAYQALAWACGENAQRPSLACLPRLKKLDNRRLSAASRDSQKDAR